MPSGINQQQRLYFFKIAGDTWKWQRKDVGRLTKSRGSIGTDSISQL